MGGYAWFANKGIGRPKADSLADTTSWFETWLSEYAKGRSQIFIIGFSGGGAFAGALAWRHPERYAGVGLLYCTMPWDAGCDERPNRLANLPLFIAQGDSDQVIPIELQQRSWNYITTESAAVVTSHRGPEGHGLTQDGVSKISEWLISLIK
jgi:phospholipase/carboxylesterase